MPFNDHNLWWFKFYLSVLTICQYLFRYFVIWLKRLTAAYSLQRTTILSRRNLLLIHMLIYNIWPALLGQNPNALLKARSWCFCIVLHLEHVQRAMDCKWQSWLESQSRWLELLLRPAKLSESQLEKVLGWVNGDQSSQLSTRNGWRTWWLSLGLKMVNLMKMMF